MLPDRLQALLLVVVGLTAVWLMMRWRSSRLRRKGAADLLAPASRIPVVLAFSTPDCVPCKTVQKPALEELQRQFPGRFEVRDIDATAEPVLARRFGIFTVPSTVVISERGEVAAINQGTADWRRLAAQLGLNGRADSVKISHE